jgi:capsular polysaccharide transport system permease protein
MVVPWPGERRFRMTVQQNFDLFDQRIDLVRLEERTHAPARPNGTQTAQSPLAWAMQKLNVPAIVIGLPTIIAVIYFLGLAASRYESVSTFVVRSPSAASVSEIASLVQGTGIITSPDDAYIVGEYMRSRDAMQDLIDNNGLLAVFHRSGWDPAWATPGTFWRSNKERLYRHYQDFISVEFDKTTSISTLHVQAFTPNDAQNIAAALLQKSEALLNRLNERAQSDAVASALKQVDASKDWALAAQQKVTEFRNREAVIDPTLQSTIVLETVSGLALEMAESNAQLAELLKSSPDSPQIGSLRRRVAALENQIAKERAQFGGSAASLAPRIAEYERLSLEREFAERAFVSALNTLESAKIDAQRRRTYLEQISRPSLPDYARYPFRLTWIIVIAACNFAAYWVLRYVVRDTLAHAGA